MSGRGTLTVSNMETDKMSTASSVGAERQTLMQALVIERRILFGCTVLVGLSTFVWISAVCTEKWVTISGGPHGIYLPSNRYLLWSESGVWETCRHLFQPNISSTTAAAVKTNTTTVESTTAWPLDPKNLTGSNIIKCLSYLAQPAMENGKFVDPAYDVDIANYVRTMISFGIISLFVMTMGCGFSVYTFQNPRYMFKRLAAGIHFISTSCTFVVVQVMMSAVEQMRKSVKFVYPVGATHYYNISFFLAWFVVLINFCAAASFLWYSRKRKGDKAATDELAMADEPTIIGR